MKNFLFILRDTVEPKIKGSFFLITIPLCFFFFLIINLQIGINSYKAHQKELIYFNEIESLKPKLFPTYGFYGTYGISIISSPSTVSALFMVNTILSHIDTGIRMEIIQNLKKRGMVSALEIKGYCGFVLVFILALSIYLGIKGHEWEKIKLFKSIMGDISFWYIFISKFILISIIFISLIIFAYFYCLLNGLLIPVEQIMFFLFSTEIAIIFFLFVGSIFDFYFNKIKVTLSISFYFLSLFILTGIIHELTAVNNETIQLELKNLKLLMQFESRFFSIVGKWDSEKPAPKYIVDLIKSGQENEYKEMKKNEMALYKNIKEKIKLRHFIYSLFPPTYIISVQRELSGNDRFLIEFYNFSKLTREKFIDYYIDNRYIKGSKRGDVKKYPENQILTSKSYIPYYSLVGLIISILFTIGIILISRHGYIKLFKSKESFVGLDINLKKRVLNYFFTKNENLKNYIFQSFMEKSSIVSVEKDFENFIYLPEIDFIPDNIEKLFSEKKYDEKMQRWERIIRAAIDSDGVVLASWNIANFGEIKMERMLNIISTGIFINCGDDLITYWLSENKLSWSNDPSIDGINLYALADRLSEKE